MHKLYVRGVDSLSDRTQVNRSQRSPFELPICVLIYYFTNVPPINLERVPIKRIAVFKLVVWR